MQSDKQEIMDCIVSIDPYTAKSGSIVPFKREGCDVVFCVILLILVIEMTLLLSIVLWRFFDVDLLSGSFGHTNHERFNITNYNDYSHHHYRIES